MVDLAKLRDVMKRKGVDMDQAAKAMGINKCTLYRRFQRDGATFTIGELERLAPMLDLSWRSLQSIFFAGDSQHCKKGEEASSNDA